MFSRSANDYESIVNTTGLYTLEVDTSSIISDMSTEVKSGHRKNVDYIFIYYLN